MTKKFLLITSIVFSLSCFTLRAQSIVVETTNSDSTVINLTSIRSIKFSNHMMVFNKTDNTKSSVNLFLAQKAYFSEEHVSGIINSSISDISIYPNPVTEYFLINDLSLSQTDLFVYSLSGQKVLQTTVSSVNNYVDVSQLDAGMYIIKMNSQTLKFIKF